MLIITIEVRAPGWAAQGVKEHLAMCLEKFGDVRVTEIRETGPGQMKIGEAAEAALAAGKEGVKDHA